MGGVAFPTPEMERGTTRQRKEFSRYGATHGEGGLDCISESQSAREPSPQEQEKEEGEAASQQSATRWAREASWQLLLSVNLTVLLPELQELRSSQDQPEKEKEEGKEKEERGEEEAEDQEEEGGGRARKKGSRWLRETLLSSGPGRSQIIIIVVGIYLENWNPTHSALFFWGK